MGTVVPFVPGDSIFEAFRLASQAGIEVALVDTDVSVAGEQRPERTLAIGPEFASRPGDGFFAAVAALNNREAPLVSDLAREAAMAAALAALMAQHESVWWVGGFAHWSRIIERLQSNNFSGPEAEPAPRRRFVRARLASSALLRLTGFYPAIPAGVRAKAEAVRAIRRHADSPARGRDSRARCLTWRRPSPQRPSTWPEPACMRETSRRPPASASSRSWPNSCWRPAPPLGPAMRRGSSPLRRPSPSPRPARCSIR